jgi:hypothetical protein
MSLYISKGRGDEEADLKELLDNLKEWEILHMQEDALFPTSMFNYTVVFIEENFARKM